MPTTTYKGYSVPTTGTETNTWGDEINDNTFGVMDRNMGGIVAKSLSSSNISLSSTEAEYLILRLTGTLSSNVQVTSAAQGMTIVENLTTGAFAVTFTNGVAGIIVPQGARSVVIADASNGARIAVNSFATGTAMLFAQAAAPVGWTISASQDNAAVRIVSSSGGGTGGSANFTSAFASQAVSGTVGDTTLTIAQIPAHTHTYTLAIDNNSPTGSGATRIESSTSSTTGSTGGGNSHTHTFTGNAINLAVKYRDVILCTKD